MTTTVPAWPVTGHLVQFYATDDDLTESVADFVLDGAHRDSVSIIVATAAHRQAFERRLAERGMDTAAEQLNRTLVLIDAEATLHRFLQDDRLDSAGFDAVIGGLVREGVAAGRPVRIYGEMVAVLWDAGQVNLALELEELWNELGCRVPFALLCGYPNHATLAGAEAISGVCGAHSGVVGQPSELLLDETTRTFARSVTAPAAVRRFVASALGVQSYGLRMDDVLLTASELATNAVLHGHSDVTVTVLSTDVYVRVSVADSSPTLPVPTRPVSDASSGRGLYIVDIVSTAWGYELTPTGKLVWAEFDRSH